ncbi:membrane protein [Schumannella luteola]|uniref:Uncharacterized membrane protein HdeD (DUF308 family) n=1 Tax=Schumannella luteola TaxID=472059 RepID=A0A852YHE4_9MICO|nr:hypothetical protein [Schumannella luteola]NYG98488.1 uncharacterized membrane protein HdeD (DUF308 family) [Schumannella luteola]TPX01286.1 hypothetical protein FJ656_28255 [Schumannella luteola]
MTDTGTASEISTPVQLPPLASALRRLYFLRFGFAVVWAIALVAVTSVAAPGPLFTTLLIVYPLVDAAAVIWQLRAERGGSSSRVAEWINVVMSVVAAVALGWASTVSIGAALAVWGVWAVVAGISQLVAALLRRRAGGQIPQVLSGGISVFAGLGFLFQGLGGGASATGIAGYATLGGIFFLVSAIRLSVLLRRAARG